MRMEMERRENHLVSLDQLYCRGRPADKIKNGDSVRALSIVA
jgi:hypothetical protein